jgi:carboxylesterase
MADLLGTSAFSVAGGPAGALLVHGFGGSPFGMRRIGARLAARGLAVEAPLLPGHGTVVEDLVPLRWRDWAMAAEDAFERLRSQCERVAVVGHSMGGTLACWLAQRHPDVLGIAVVNPFVEPFGDELRRGAQALLDSGTEIWPGQEPDVADVTAASPSYRGTPLAALLSLNEGAEEVARGLDRISCPVLVISSRVDHVVPPQSGDRLLASVAGPAERVWLERSYHNAMVDYDHEEVESRIEAFVVSVTAGEPQQVRRGAAASLSPPGGTPDAVHRSPEEGR